MASGGSYQINENGERELKQRSGHKLTPEHAAPAAQTKKVNTDENTQKSAAGRR
ncbi:hypothetical protein GCM10022421_08950 [Oceanisphaera sediminis]|uniref:Uncharacterized protein n=1 Tax=Oceanisphaera sediminis TaxID=981381 RepID=A0ABP7DHB2_9GAMM